MRSQDAAVDTSVADEALGRLLGLLRARDYRFVTTTPATHARVVARAERAQARSVEDVLGWSLPFEAGLLPPEIHRCLADAGALEEHGDLLRCRVRASSLHGMIFLHSAYPTEAEDSVFFGPDSYRFADLIARELERCPAPARARIVDLGAGAGVGGILAMRLCPDAAVLLTDVNPKALRLAGINAGASGCAVNLVETSGMEGLEGPFDLVLINPPYIIDPAARAYRDGGGLHGAELSLDLATAAIARLAPGGRLILYTGSAVIAGADGLESALVRATEAAGCTLSYCEIDPDVFGEELENEAYRDVDRIALVAAIATRPAAPPQ